MTRGRSTAGRRTGHRPWHLSTARHDDAARTRSTRVQAMGAIGAPTRARARWTAHRPARSPSRRLTMCSSTSSSRTVPSASCWRASGPPRRSRRGWRSTSSVPRSASAASPTSRTRRSASTSTTSHRPLGRAWTHDLEIPVDDVGVVEAGIRHFIDVLSRRRRADPDRRACTPRARHHREGVCVDRGRRLARDRNDLLTRYRDSPTRKYVSIGPLPLISISPRGVRRIDRGVGARRRQ